jgi:hypothetical protein
MSEWWAAALEFMQQITNACDHIHAPSKRSARRTHYGEQGSAIPAVDLIGDI